MSCLVAFVFHCRISVQLSGALLLGIDRLLVGERILWLQIRLFKLYYCRRCPSLARIMAALPFTDLGASALTLVGVVLGFFFF